MWFSHPCSWSVISPLQILFNFTIAETESYIGSVALSLDIGSGSKQKSTVLPGSTTLNGLTWIGKKRKEKKKSTYSKYLLFIEAKSPRIIWKIEPASASYLTSAYCKGVS